MSVKQKELVPKRRFEKFNDKWEECEVSEIGNTYFGGGTPKTSKLEYWDGNIPWIQSSDISEDIFKVSNTKRYITNAGLKNSAARLVPARSIAIVTRVGVGKLALMPYEYSTSQDFFSISNLNVDAYFGVYMMYKLLQSKKNDVQGTSIKGITKNELLSMNVSIAKKIEEQQKIGQFFKHLDEMITLEQRKIDKTKALKSAYLAEMFPAEGESVPKRRFEGFTDEWKTKILGNIGHTFTGLSGKTKEDFGHGSAEFVPYLNIFNHAIANINITEKIERDFKQDEVKYGDVLFTTSSETPDEVGMSSIWLDNRPNVYLNSFSFVYRINIDINYLFIAYLFRASMMRKQMEILAQGISRYNISKAKVMEIPILLPSLKEQEKIGKFFKNLDEMIATHKQKLEKLKATKQAYLHEMFV